MKRKKPGFDDFENIQPLQMEKVAKAEEWILSTDWGKWHRGKAERVTVQSFVKTSERSKAQTIQSHKGALREIKGRL